MEDVSMYLMAGLILFVQDCYYESYKVLHFITDKAWLVFPLCLS